MLKERKKRKNQGVRIDLLKHSWEDEQSILEHNKKFEKCSYKRWTPEGIIYSCRSQICRNELCRKKHAEKQAQILEFSLLKKPCQFVFNLKINDEEPIKDFQMATYLANFNDQIKYIRTKEKIILEYDLRIEFKNGRPHVHGSLIISNVVGKRKCAQLLRESWINSCELRPTRVYFDNTKTQIGNAKYVTKNLKDRSGVELPPANWDTKKCRLNRATRNFFVYPKDLIWKIMCDFYDICRTGLNLKLKKWFYDESIDWLKEKYASISTDWLENLFVVKESDCKRGFISAIRDVLLRVFEPVFFFFVICFQRLVGGRNKAIDSNPLINCMEAGCSFVGCDDG